MSLLRRCVRAIQNLLWKSRVERELDDEVRAYVDELAREKAATGLDSDAARRQAMVELGGAESVKEQVRQARAGALLDHLWQDIRYGLRVLRKSPGFTVVAVLTLALGIGANTAIFSLLNSLNYRSLPVDRPEELAEIRNVVRKSRSGNFSGRRPELTYTLWRRIQEGQEGFSGVLAWFSGSLNLSARGEDRFAENSLWVSGDFFSVLGVRPAIGRLFNAGDDQPGCASPGVVLSYPFWQREFGGEHSAVGRKMTLNGHPFTIVGVTPPKFFGAEVGRQFDLAIPICAEAILDPNGQDPQRSRLARRDAWWLAAMGRLKPGWTLERATAQLTAISPAIYEETVPAIYTPDRVENYKALRLGAVPAATGVSWLRTTYTDPLWLLLGVTGLVLLIACANLANLMLARASARERELAVRLALGAPRGRIARQMLTESLLLALAGAALGGWLAGSLSRGAVALISQDVRPLFVNLEPDGRVLGFTMGLAVFTCLLFGVAPALRATRTSPITAMNAAVRGSTASRERFGMRRALVVSQVALSLVLLVGALLFGRSLRNLLTLDTGFQQDGILQLDIQMRTPQERRHEVRREMLERLRALPGVQAAASSTHVPLGGNRWDDAVYTEGPAGQKTASALFNAVSPDYFKTLNIPHLAGRDFTQHDAMGAPRVAIVNEAMVHALFDGADPLGRTIWEEVRPGQERQLLQIVGVVRNSKYSDLREEMKPTLFLPVAQLDRAGDFNAILLRSTLSMDALAQAVKSEVQQAYPAATFHFHVFKAQIRQSLMQERLMATLTGFFGALAALLAGMGLYGVMSYTVARRTNEIGVRMALGAQRRDVLTLILREAVLLLALGLVIGTGLAFYATRATGAMLFGLAPQDPVTLATAVGLLAAVALGSSYLPARRAARLDPMAALRLE